MEISENGVYIDMANFFTRMKPQTGNKAPLSFEDLLSSHVSQLWHLSSSLCNYNKADAEDLLQDSMLRAFKARDTLMSVNNPLAWLKRVVVNTYLNSIRADRVRRSTREIEESDSTHEAYESIPSSLIEVLHSSLWNDDIMLAMFSLSPDARTLFLLSDLEGFTHDELAEMYDLPKGTVSSRIYRARRKLAKQLESYALKQGLITTQKLQVEREEMNAAMQACADRARKEQEVYQQLSITNKPEVPE